MTLNSSIHIEICGSCMTDRQEYQLSQELPRRQANLFLEFVHNDFGEPFLTT